MIVKERTCERGTMRYKITDKTTYVELAPQLFSVEDIFSFYFFGSPNVTCLNITEVLLPLYKLRKICHHELVSNLAILGSRTSNVTFLIVVCTARDIRSLSFSVFPFSRPSFLFPFFDEIPMKIFNASDNVGLHRELCR